MSCRWTDAIVERVTGPDAPGLDRDAERHLTGCRHCRAAVDRAERLDAALAMDLRRHRTAELPRIVLDAPMLPRRRGGWRASASLVAVTATLGLAAVASGVALNPPPSATPEAAAVNGSGDPIETVAPSPSAGEPQPLPPLEVGRVVAVVNEPDVDVPLVVRTEPGTADPATISPERLHTGQRVRLLDGPVEANGYPWYEVTVGEVTGWVSAEAKDGSAPWLAPLADGEVLYTANDGTLKLTATTEDAARDFLTAPLGSAQPVPECRPSTSAAWSPDGEYAIVTDTPACEGSIYRLSPDGTDPQRLGNGLAPAISPDGTQVAFGLNVPGDDPDGPWEIQVVDAEGRAAPASVISDPPGFAAGHPAWAPDGRRLAFSGYDVAAADSPSVHVYDGEVLRDLGPGRSPTWSPDGRWVVFLRGGEGGPANLVRVHPDGTGEEAFGIENVASVAFSPDGKLIAISTRDAEGRGSTRIGAFEVPFVADAEVPGAIAYAWSPTGEQVTWTTTEQDGAPTIWVARDGGAAQRFAAGAEASWRPVIDK